MARSSAAAPRSRSPAATSAVPRLSSRAGVGWIAFAFSNAAVDCAYCFAAYCFTPRAVARYELRWRQTGARSMARGRSTIIPHLDLDPTAPARPAHSTSFRTSIRERPEHQQREGGAERPLVAVDRDLHVLLAGRAA